jgi:hypothetical protein
MVPPTALVPVVLLLALGADAAPSHDRRSWGGRQLGTRAQSAPTVTTTTRASGDLQTYNSGAGSIYAPAVTTSNGYFYQSNQQYNSLYDALVASCYVQAQTCQTTPASVLGDKSTCWGSVSRRDRRGRRNGG